MLQVSDNEITSARIDQLLNMLHLVPGELGALGLKDLEDERPALAQTFDVNVLAAGGGEHVLAGAQLVLDHFAHHLLDRGGNLLLALDHPRGMWEEAQELEVPAGDVDRLVNALHLVGVVGHSLEWKLVEPDIVSQGLDNSQKNKIALLS